MDARTLVKLLAEKKLTVAFAESCTGGLLAGALTGVSGSSAVFGLGIISYSNEAKINLLGVKEQTLLDYGAVSAQTAEEMAAGVKALSGADIAVSVTGIAGPGGGSGQKPVGTVFICALGVQGARAECFLFPGNREDIRNRTVEAALKMAADAAAENL